MISCISVHQFCQPRTRVHSIDQKWLSICDKPVGLIWPVIFHPPLCWNRVIRAYIEKSYTKSCGLDVNACVLYTLYLNRPWNSIVKSYWKTTRISIYVGRLRSRYPNLYISPPPLLYTISRFPISKECPPGERPKIPPIIVFCHKKRSAVVGSINISEVSSRVQNEDIAFRIVTSSDNRETLRFCFFRHCKIRKLKIPTTLV